MGKKRSAHFTKNESGQVFSDFDSKKVEDGFKDIEKAQSQALNKLTEMVQSMELYQKIAPKTIEKLQTELDRLSTEKATRETKKQIKEIEKVLNSLVAAKAEAATVLSDKNVDPTQTSQAYRDLALAFIDAKSAAAEVAINAEREKLAIREAALLEQEKTKEIIRQRLETERSYEERIRLQEELNKLDSERKAIDTGRSKLTEKEGNVRETKASDKADVNKKVRDLDVDLPSANKSKIEAAGKALKESVDGFVKVLNAINITKIAESLQLEESDRKRIRKESEYTFGLSHADFETYKNDTIKEMTNGLDGLFNSSDLHTYLQEANKFGFKSAEEAATMSQQIMIGNKVLGQSFETMQASYQLQKSLGDQNWMKKSMNRMAGLLDSQLGVSREQLDEIMKQNTEDVESAAINGMSKEALDEFSKQMAAVDVADPSGRTRKVLEEYMNADVDQRALMLGSNYRQADQNFWQTGDVNSLLEAIKNSEASQSRDSISSNGETSAVMRGFGSDNVHAWMKLQNEDYDAKFAEAINAQDNGDANKIAEDQLEKMTAQEKITNGISLKAEEVNWNYIIAIEDTLQIIEKSIKAIEVMLGIIAVKDIVTSLIDMGKALKGKGVGSSISKFMKGTGGKVLGAASLVAGLAWTGIDAYNGAKNGITDEQGNQVIGPGAKSGFIGAVSGTKVATSESAGSSKKASQENVGGGALNGAGKGALIGAGIGSFIGPAGTVVGGLVGGLIGGISGAIGGVLKDQERRKLESEKKTQEELKNIADNTFATEKAIGSLGTQVSVRWRPDQVSYGGVENNNYMPANYVSNFNSNSASSSLGKGGASGGEWNGMDIGQWTMTSPYGYRKDPFGSGKTTYHSGIDFATSSGTPIGSASAGTVTFAGMKGGYGNLTIIRGNDGRDYYYAHQVETPPVKVGDQVSAGQLIGKVGSTGNSTGPHLHFEVRENGKAVSPDSFVNTGIFNLDPSATTVGDQGLSKEQMLAFASQMSNKEGTKSADVVRDIAKRNFTYNLNDLSMGGQGGSDNAPVVAGLKEIKQTLLDLSKKQNYQQRLIDALSTKPIKLST